MTGHASISFPQKGLKNNDTAVDTIVSTAVSDLVDEQGRNTNVECFAGSFSILVTL